MPPKRIFLYVGAPLGNMEGIRLPGVFDGNVAYLGSFLDSEDIKNLGNVVLKRKPQSTFCVSVRPWLHSDTYIWVPLFLDSGDMRKLLIGVIWNCAEGSGLLYLV